MRVTGTKGFQLHASPPLPCFLAFVEHVFIYVMTYQVFNVYCTTKTSPQRSPENDFFFQAAYALEGQCCYFESVSLKQHMLEVVRPI